MQGHMRQMYILAIVYDFMAFCAQTFRLVLQDRQGTPRHLNGIRNLLTDTLHTIEAAPDYSCELRHLFDVFRAIALEIGPIPSEDMLEDNTQDERPHKFQTPRTYHRLDDEVVLTPVVKYADIDHHEFTRYVPNYPYTEREEGASIQTLT